MTLPRRPLALLLAALLLGGCGGGVPLQLRIDEAAFRVDMGTLIAETQSALLGTGLLPPNLSELPEVWPASLSHLERSFPFPMRPVPIDLSLQEGDPNYETYRQLEDVKDAIRRIEINRLVLRVEQSNLTIPIPKLRLQVADKKDANPDDRRAWFTVGELDSIPAGEVGDYDFNWAVGGESFLNAQLGDEEKELALRVTGRVGIDTKTDPRLPSGVAALRIIVVATFFVEPEKAAAALPPAP